MTFRAAILLRQLKQAQMREDNRLVIDFDGLTAKTLTDRKEAHQEISLRRFETSLFSTLDYLKGKGFIDYEFYSGEAFVNHAGWHATEATIRTAANFAFRDVIVPIIVAALTAYITARWLN